MVRQSFFQGLAKDHRRLSDLVMAMRIEREQGELDRLVADFKEILRRHTKVEDEIVYPALLEGVKDRDDRVVLLGAHEDHRIITRLLGEIDEMSPLEERFFGKVHALDRLWNHHVGEEEGRLYMMARDHLGAKALMDLKGRVREAEKRQGKR